MANAPKLELQTNIPKTVRIKKMASQGSGEYGEWFLWIVEENGQERTFFANQYTQPQLLDFSEGDEAVFLVSEKGKSKITTIAPVGDVQVNPQSIGQPRTIDKVKQDKVNANYTDQQALTQMSIKVQSILHIPGFYDQVKDKPRFQIIQETIEFVNLMDEQILKHFEDRKAAEQVFNNPDF